MGAELVVQSKVNYGSIFDVYLRFMCKDTGN
jgi:hypothetical protein